MKKKIKFTRQFDQMDCGPSCIRMVASAYGKGYPLSVRDAMHHIGIDLASFRTLHASCARLLRLSKKTHR